jgi:hypothetical protein
MAFCVAKKKPAAAPDVHGDGLYWIPVDTRLLGYPDI